LKKRTMQEDLVEPVMQQSQLMWFYSALGFKYAVALPLAGLFSLVMTILVLVKGRGPLVSGAMAFAVAAPIFIGLLGTAQGVMASYQVMATSSETPRPSEVAQGVSMALVTTYLGLTFAFPSFAIATIGLIARALSEPDPTTIGGNLKPLPPDLR
jgi:hypothetical protein